MKTGTILLLILLGFSPLTIAAPFLKCDSYSTDELQPTAFEVTIDGRSERVVPLTYPDGSAYLHYDLKDLSDGEHLLKVKAVNDVWHTESIEQHRRINRQDGVFSLNSMSKPERKMAPSKSYRGHIRQ